MIEKNFVVNTNQNFTQVQADWPKWQTLVISFANQILKYDKKYLQFASLA